MTTLPAEHELLSVFEAEPELLDNGVPWAYNSVRFRMVRGQDQLTCEIEPASEQLRIAWHQAGAELLALDLSEVSALVVEAERGLESLVATFRNNHVKPLRLQLRPRIHLFWGTRTEVAP